MKKRATIRDIASEAGVAVSTVSRYINSNGYVEEETGKKIAEAIRKLDYRPNRLARGLKTSSTKNIVLIVPDIQNPFYSTMGVVSQRLLKEQGYTLSLFNTFGNMKEEMDSVKSAVMMGTDGVILAGGHFYSEVKEMLLELEVPVILANGIDTDLFDVVLCDEGESTYMATRYLMEQGHEKIAFVGAAVNSQTGKNRENGYRRALEEAGISTDSKYVFIMGNVLDSDAGRKAGYYFSALKERPTAVCCANDLIALGVYQACSEMGLRIPGQISVTGVDNIIFSDLCNPKLTTITNDSAEYARIFVEALLERLNGKYAGKPRKYRIQRELIIRDSVEKVISAG